MFGGFVFWTAFRTILAVIAHFNWLAAFKIKCVYVIYWKSYDLLWFWMHLYLCMCFRALRRENFIVIWYNLLLKRCTTHKAYSIKEIYMMIYAYGNSTESEAELERINTTERKELRERAIRKSIRLKNKEKPKLYFRKKPESSDESSSDEEVNELLRKGLIESNESRWKPSNIRKTLQSKYRDIRLKAEEVLLLKKPDEDDDETDVKTMTKWQRVKEIYKKITEEPKKAAEPIDIEADIDTHDVYILTPDYTNVFDIQDEKKAKRRQKRDERNLKKRVRMRVRRELEEKAEEERKRKLLTDAIDLLLTMLRVITMFALVIWNVRKRNPIASFKHLEIDFDPEQTDEDIQGLQVGRVSTNWVIALSIGVFIDFLMSFIQFFIAYYKQFRLFKRMGLWWSMLWGGIIVLVGLFGMILPIKYILEHLDVSWCRILPDKELACWMPLQWVDFPLEDSRTSCNWWLNFEGGGHRSPGGPSDFVNFDEIEPSPSPETRLSV